MPSFRMGIAENGKATCPGLAICGPQWWGPQDKYDRHDHQCARADVSDGDPGLVQGQTSEQSDDPPYRDPTQPSQSLPHSDHHYHRDRKRKLKRESRLGQAP